MNTAIDTTPRKPDYMLMATVGALVALGLVMVYSSSFVEAFTRHESQFYYLVRQLTGAIIGIIGMLVALRLDYRVWRRFSVHLMGLALVLLLLVLVLPESMTMVNGSRAWIRFSGGMFSMQPSEIAKLAMIVYFADWLSRRGPRVGNVTYGLIPFAVMLGLLCGLVMMEPDTGTTVVLLGIASIIYFAAGANLWHVLGAAVLGIGAFWAMIYLVDFENGRILAYKDPWEYYNSYGYQPIHSLYALGSGGFFGMGLGQARQKFQWLPQAHTDSIFAIVGEELGIIGTTLVLIGFGILAYRGLRIACRTSDPFASLVAIGITSWLVFQGLLNMAVTTSMLPFTGLTLPFISYGSTSLVMCMVSAGILLNISRHTAEYAPAPQPELPRVRRSPALEFFQKTGSAVKGWRGWHAPGGPRRSPGSSQRSTARHTIPYKFKEKPDGARRRSSVLGIFRAIASAFAHLPMWWWHWRSRVPRTGSRQGTYRTRSSRRAASGNRRGSSAERR